MLARCTCGWPGRSRRSLCGCKRSDYCRFLPDEYIPASAYRRICSALFEGSSENRCPVASPSLLHHFPPCATSTEQLSRRRMPATNQASKAYVPVTTATDGLGHPNPSSPLALVRGSIKLA